MAATVVGFISQKGGVGKSTLCRAVAREAVLGGLKVKVCDLDPQQATITDWNKARLVAGFEPVVRVETFKTAAQALADVNQFDLVLIDGPAQANAGTLEIAKRADLLVQPTGASKDDLNPGVKTFHALVREGIPRERLVFALNRLSTEAEETAARAFIAEAGYSVLEGAMHEKPTYRRAMDRGLAPTETQVGALNRRADMLVQNIIDRIAA